MTTQTVWIYPKSSESFNNHHFHLQVKYLRSSISQNHHLLHNSNKASPPIKNNSRARSHSRYSTAYEQDTGHSFNGTEIRGSLVAISIDNYRGFCPIVGVGNA